MGMGPVSRLVSQAASDPVRFSNKWVYLSPACRLLPIVGPSPTYHAKGIFREGIPSALGGHCVSLHGGGRDSPRGIHPLTLDGWQSKVNTS